MVVRVIFWGGSMRLLPLVQGWGLCVSRGSRPSGSINHNADRRQPFKLLAAAGILLGSILGSGVPAKANDLSQADSSVSAMKAYLSGNGSANAPASGSSGRIKVAEADSLFGAMKQFLDDRDGGSKEGAPAPKYTAPSGPVGE